VHLACHSHGHPGRGDIPARAAKRVTVFSIVRIRSDGCRAPGAAQNVRALTTPARRSTETSPTPAIAGWHDGCSVVLVDVIRHPIAAVRSLVSTLREIPRLLRREEPRLVRRVTIPCPHGRGVVEVELRTDRMGKPEAVLRCSAHESCPPTCDQACRSCAESVLTPASALIIYPPGTHLPGDA
jgi:hypothetical protein